MITNSTEFDYKLSLHASNMLFTGIEVYFENIKHLRETQIEEDDYCFLMLRTAKK